MYCGHVHVNAQYTVIWFYYRLVDIQKLKATITVGALANNYKSHTEQQAADLRGHVVFVIVNILWCLQTELYELEQELKAVHNMYMQGYIGNSQLCKLEYTIVSETASVKPQIRTKSTRSVSQLAQKFENTTQKDSHIKVNWSQAQYFWHACYNITKLCNEYWSCLMLQVGEETPVIG